MGEKFSSLSSFLNNTKKIERNTLETALTSNTDAEVQRILSESAVRLSVASTSGSNMNADGGKGAAEFIQQSIQEAVAVNASKVKSILDDIFSNVKVSEEHEEFWVNKLCQLFNIDVSLPIEVRSALIDKQLADDDDTLNYVTYLVESGEKKMSK